MPEDKDDGDTIKVTLDYLRGLRTDEIDTMRERFSAKKTAFDQYYAGEAAKTPRFGNPALLPSAGVLADEVKQALTKVEELFDKYEKDLLAISKGIADSELVFDDLEEDAELTADQLNRIFGSSSPSGGAGGDFPGGSSEGSSGGSSDGDGPSSSTDEDGEETGEDEDEKD
ncbi:hypothetical protein O4J56_01075 [Nocardiopsis sp. RSe5-2]|uniref:DivIVA domain-containing protein n=1 Tax=Nocardiopsis endophytica TaxID=3018445 RepID=A0ABT4TX20_9ACTN|nr:hypothetical protein [Nocardiopsis endophytica]MDA2809215.1 hypothetical protein [Nocardiopsis endophytica]